MCVKREREREIMTSTFRMKTLKMKLHGFFIVRVSHCKLTRSRDKAAFLQSKKRVTIHSALLRVYQSSFFFYDPRAYQKKMFN